MAAINIYTLKFSYEEKWKDHCLMGWQIKRGSILLFLWAFSHYIGLLGLFLGQGNNREKEVGNVDIGGVGLRDDG